MHSWLYQNTSNKRDQLTSIFRRQPRYRIFTHRFQHFLPRKRLSNQRRPTRFPIRRKSHRNFPIKIPEHPWLHCFPVQNPIQRLAILKNQQFPDHPFQQTKTFLNHLPYNDPKLQTHVPAALRPKDRHPLNHVNHHFTVRKLPLQYLQGHPWAHFPNLRACTKRWRTICTRNGTEHDLQSDH